MLEVQEETDHLEGGIVEGEEMETKLRGWTNMVLQLGLTTESWLRI